MNGKKIIMVFMSLLNFPSRLLSYVYAKLPVLACVEESADIGDIIEQAGFAWKSYSDNSKEIEVYQKIMGHFAEN